MNRLSTEIDLLIFENLAEDARHSGHLVLRRATMASMTAILHLSLTNKHYHELGEPFLEAVMTNYLTLLDPAPWQDTSDIKNQLPYMYWKEGRALGPVLWPLDSEEHLRRAILQLYMTSIHSLPSRGWRIWAVRKTAPVFAFGFETPWSGTLSQNQDPTTQIMEVHLRNMKSLYPNIIKLSWSPDWTRDGAEILDQAVIWRRWQQKLSGVLWVERQDTANVSGEEGCVEESKGDLISLTEQLAIRLVG